MLTSCGSPLTEGERGRYQLSGIRYQKRCDGNVASSDPCFLIPDPCPLAFGERVTAYLLYNGSAT